MTRLYKVRENEGELKLAPIDTETFEPDYLNLIHATLLDGFEEGDVVYWSMEDKEYLLVFMLTAQQASENIKMIMSSGLTYSELDDELKQCYNDSIATIKKCYKEPTLCSKELTLKFLATRKEFKEGEI